MSQSQFVHVHGLFKFKKIGKGIKLRLKPELASMSKCVAMIVSIHHPGT